MVGGPLATYIKEGEEEAGQGVARQGGGPTWTSSPSRIRPPFLPSNGGGKEGRRGEEEGKGGRAPSP